MDKNNRIDSLSVKVKQTFEKYDFDCQQLRNTGHEDKIKGLEERLNLVIGPIITELLELCDKMPKPKPV